MGKRKNTLVLKLSLKLYLLARVCITPLLRECHEPLDARQPLPLNLRVHDVSDLVLVDLLAASASVDADHRNADRPGGAAYGYVDVGVVGLDELVGLAVLNYGMYRVQHPRLYRPALEVL